MNSTPNAVGIVRNLCAATVLFLAVVQCANAASPSDVVGPFSPYPPYGNPWVNNNYTTNWPATTTGTASGADIVRNGETNMRTPGGVNVKVPVKVTTSVTKEQIAKAATRAARFNPAGVAAGIILPALIEEGIRRCDDGSLGAWCKDDKQFPDIPPEFRWTINGDTAKFFTSGTAACDYGWQNYYSAGFPATHYTFSTKQTAETTIRCVATSKSSGSSQEVFSAIAVKRCPDGYGEKTIINGQTYCEKVGPNPITQRPASEPEMEDATKKGQDKDPSRSPNFADGARRDGYSPDSPSLGGAPAKWDAPSVQTPERQSGQTTTKNPDGSITTKTETTKEVVTPKTTGNSTNNTNITHYHITNITTTTTHNNVTNQTTVEEKVDNPAEQPNSDPNGDPPPEQGPKECGSPGKPKCLIDETGTPDAQATKTIADQQIETAKAPYDEMKTVIGQVNESSINGNWLPNIPTAGCMNPKVPHPLSGAEFEVPYVCSTVDLLRAVIQMATAFLGLVGAVRQVEEVTRS